MNTVSQRSTSTFLDHHAIPIAKGWRSEINERLNCFVAAESDSYSPICLFVYYSISTWYSYLHCHP